MPGWIYLVIFLAIIISFLAYKNSEKQKEIDDLRIWHRNEILRKEQECSDKIERRDATSNRLSWFESQIKIRKAELDELYTESNRIKSEIAEREAASRKELEAMRQDRKQLLKDIDQLRVVRRRLKSAPLDVHFAADGLPVYWKSSAAKPYGDYTVFLSRRTGVFHKDKYCAPYDAVTSHLFNALSVARPCRRCAGADPNNCKIPDWFAEKTD